MWGVCKQWRNDSVMNLRAEYLQPTHTGHVVGFRAVKTVRCDHSVRLKCDIHRYRLHRP